MAFCISIGEVIFGHNLKTLKYWRKQAVCRLICCEGTEGFASLSTVVEEAEQKLMMFNFNRHGALESSSDQIESKSSCSLHQCGLFILQVNWTDCDRRRRRACPHACRWRITRCSSLLRTVNTPNNDTEIYGRLKKKLAKSNIQIRPWEESSKGLVLNCFSSNKRKDQLETEISFS